MRTIRRGINRMLSEGDGVAGRHRRIASIAICASALALLVTAAPALADRTFESKMSGFTEPHAIAIDTSDNVWVTDMSTALVSKYDAFPSETLLTQLDGEGQWGGSYLWGLGVNSSTGFVYVADSGPVVVDVVDDTGAVVDRWNGFQGGYDFVSVDNSGGPTNGRVYIAVAGNYVEAVDAEDQPINFTSPETWVSGNRLTGSPAGNFGTPWNVYVDSDGNIYVVDRDRKEVVEFDPTGEFVRAITEEGVPGGFGELTGVAVDPTSGNILVVDSGNNVVDEFDTSGFNSQIKEAEGQPFTHLAGGIAVNSSGYVYVADSSGGAVDIFSPNVILPKISYGALTNPGQTSMTVNGTIDPNGGPDVTKCQVEYGTSTAYGATMPCSPNPSGSPFSAVTDVSANLSGLTNEATYHYRFLVESVNGTKKGGDKTFIPHAVVGLTTEPAGPIGPVSATLKGSWLGNGEDTHYFFEWGRTSTYGNITAAPPGIDAGGAPGATHEQAEITGLNPITTYHFRIVASNSVGTSRGADEAFTTPPNAPLVNQWVTTVHSDSAVLHANINPGGGLTTYHFEWGTADCAVSACNPAPIPELKLKSNVTPEDVSLLVTGLEPGTTYHYRVVATNALDTTDGPDRTYTTFPYSPLLEDTCSNAHARQQTGSALLPDCRGYELVSAADTGGYDVESDLVPGQSPFGGYPQASDPSRVLYGLHYGALPGAGNPSNFGLDPYVATRTDEGWTTQYVGIPAQVVAGVGPFASTVGQADDSLGTFVFSGPEICSPCFANGSVGIPVHTPSGSLVQGMAGSLDPGAGATQSGYVGKQLSADGSHLVFGSTAKFEPDGNGDGDISIYDRNLTTGVTHVVSKTTAGATMTGPGTGELDISSNGSRIVVGKLISTDSAGNRYWHPYMDIGDSGSTVDLAPGTTDGAIYDGMTADGSAVFLTTTDKLLPSDGDTSADLYEATVDSAGAVTLHLLSSGAGGSGNTDICDPDLSSSRPHWNAVENSLNCDVVAIAGGGGIASGDGTVYFLSPEKLDGASNGKQDEPNLYVVRPGAAPHFVATLETDNPAVVDGVSDSEAHRYGDFQVTPNGDDAAFASRLSLTEYSNAGHEEIYRYDAASGQLACASCAPTGAQATGDAFLPSKGLGLSDDGRVFFTSTDPLAPSDNNGKKDAYEWNDGEIGLISTGIGFFDAGVLSASADGVDVYFFTRDTLAPQDHNGSVMKIYDARVEGGFPFNPPSVPCQASDECHGPGSQAAGPPNIGSYKGSGGNLTGSEKKHKRHKHHHKRRHRHTKGRGSHGHGG